MPRPKTKSELIFLCQVNFNKLLDHIASLSKIEQERNFPKGTLNRNIRDVLAHLHHWHLLMMEWYRVGMKGEKPDMPAKGHTWKTLPELNLEIQQQYAEISLDEARKLFEESYNKVQTLISKHNDEELFEKKRYGWTGTTSLGAYLIANTSCHYDWAVQLIKRCLKK